MHKTIFLSLFTLYLEHFQSGKERYLLKHDTGRCAFNVHPHILVLHPTNSISYLFQSKYNGSGILKHKQKSTESGIRCSS